MGMWRSGGIGASRQEIRKMLLAQSSMLVCGVWSVGEFFLKILGFRMCWEQCRPP